MTNGHEEDATEGKEAVRMHFIQRLADAGLVRPKGMTEVRQAEMVKGLMKWLSYMDAENLIVLAEVVIDNAPGGRWPSEALIRDWAKRLQERPAVQHPIIASWLASKEGPEAQMRGDLVEMYRYLIERPLPLGPYDRRLIAEQVDKNQRDRCNIEGRIERGTDTPEDRAWIAAYSTDLRTANDIVAAGQERRAAKANGEAA